MKKISLNFVKAVGYLVVAYAAFFFLWLFLMSACLQKYEGCGDDLMTQAVRTFYSPVVRLQKTP